MQGDRTKKVGVIDSEYIVHQGIQTLGGRGPHRRKVIHFTQKKKSYLYHYFYHFVSFIEFCLGWSLSLQASNTEEFIKVGFL